MASVSKVIHTDSQLHAGQFGKTAYTEWIPLRVDTGGIMKLPRRKFLHLAAGAAAFPTLPRIAWAQTYPTRPVHIIVGFPAGGTSDIFTRIVGQWLSERLGQQFIIENRPGAASSLAAEAVVRAPPDGYTLLAVTSSNAWNATLYSNLNFDLIHDIAPVASTVRGQGVMLVNPVFPANSVPEFIAYAKANPGKINFASAGIGSAPHVYGELFNLMTGINMVHVPYSSGGSVRAFTDLIGGRIQVIFDPISSSIELIRAGKVRALAVTSVTRSEVLPDVPVIGDFVAGYEASGWQGIGAPKNTPADIVEKLNGEINVALADPSMKARFVDFGYAAFPNLSADFGKFIAEEVEKWGKVFQAANIKVE